MPATQTAQSRSARATERVRLRSDAFDRRTGELGATTEKARALLCSIDRATLRRMRLGHTTPSLHLAMHMSQKLGLRVEELFEHPAST